MPRKKTKKKKTRKSASLRPRSGEQWACQSRSDGIVTFRLESWSNFFDFLETEVFQTSPEAWHSYIWRGQRDKGWSLSSSLDRLFERLGLAVAEPDEFLTKHLSAFKYATRGRRGPVAEALLENDWWALGQHFGLATPLLDWTHSPFAAAYFAFELHAPPTDYRVVFGLNQVAIRQKSDELLDARSVEKGRPPIVEFIDPMSNENPRLVSQGGLFTRAPVGVSIERWVSQQFEGSDQAVLLRIEIPDKERLTCLRTLDLMNINHLSLFPDLTGASRYTNLKWELKP